MAAAHPNRAVFRLPKLWSIRKNEKPPFQDDSGPPRNFAKRPVVVLRRLFADRFVLTRKTGRKNPSTTRQPLRLYCRAAARCARPVSSLDYLREDRSIFQDLECESFMKFHS